MELPLNHPCCGAKVADVAFGAQGNGEEAGFYAYIHIRSANGKYAEKQEIFPGYPGGERKVKSMLQVERGPSGPIYFNDVEINPNNPILSLADWENWLKDYMSAFDLEGARQAVWRSGWRERYQ